MPQTLDQNWSTLVSLKTGPFWRCSNSNVLKNECLTVDVWGKPSLMQSNLAKNRFSEANHTKARQISNTSHFFAMKATLAPRRKSLDGVKNEHQNIFKMAEKRAKAYFLPKIWPLISGSLRRCKKCLLPADECDLRIVPEFSI